MLLFLGRKLFKKEQDGGNGGLSLQVCSVSKKVLHLEQFDASGMVKLPKIVIGFLSAVYTNSHRLLSENNLFKLDSEMSQISHCSEI